MNKIYNMNSKLSFWLIFIITAFILAIAFAQTKKLTLEDIYTNGVYRAKGIGQVRWMKDNKGYSTLENNAEAKGTDIVVYNAESGTRNVLVNAKQLDTGRNKQATVHRQLYLE